MRQGGTWLVIVVLAGCASARMIDTDAAQGAESEQDTSDPSTGPADAGLASFDAGALGLGGEAGCVYLSQRFEEGSSFRDNDGCNTCDCQRGLVFCTLAGCGGRPANCDLPFDPGSCDESHLYYAYNASTGLCEAKTYSGCGGNFNRFEEYGECAVYCSVRPGRGQDCTYEGNTYRHRQRVARKPSEMIGCGPCLCNDGQVLCPPADCECPSGQKLGLQCVGCTGDGGCSSLEERCFPACDDDADCETQYGVFCDKTQGVCVGKPGCLR